jgi:serine/threonine protein kinase HipA of HipAB toxin-antitoxin module
MPGSSVGGEQPKFSAYLEDERSVLVKFSPDKSTEKGIRWADLLVAEYLALETVEKELKISAARTEIIEANNRVYLESTRFDRVGRNGRKGILSFQALELEYVGSPSTWSASAQALTRMKKISQADFRSILMLDTFGELIANSDRHYGNISFFFDLRDPNGKVTLAPAYDMLPMFFAPKESELKHFSREWKMPVSNALNLPIWDEARSAALRFWERVINDGRISPDFKNEAKKVARHLKG